MTGGLAPVLVGDASSSVSSTSSGRNWQGIALLTALALVFTGIRVYLGFAPYRPLGFEATGRFLVGFIAYLAAARATLYLAPGNARTWGFALANIGGIALLLDWHEGRVRQLFLLTTILGMVGFHYTMFRVFVRRAGWWPWVAFFSPIVVLIAIRHVPALQAVLEKVLPGVINVPLVVYYVGISYLTFRLSQLVIEVRNGIVNAPDLGEYLGFAFFVPTFVVGPINSYHVHQSSLENPSREVTPIGRSLMRMVVGLAKYQFLGNLLNQLSYQRFLLDGQSHPVGDLVIAAVAYHLYLYCNFSGVCDMAIGAAGLLGIRVKENFRNPFGARSVQEYWTRWHITLSSWMRDFVFSPLSKYLTEKLGPRNVPHAVGISIAVVFLLVGVWHGVGWNYALFGAAHAVALTFHHYYTLWLKRRLKKETYRAFQSNRWVNAAGVVITFACTTAFLFIFANDMEAARKIFAAIRF